MRKITATVIPLNVFPPEDARKFCDWIWNVRELTCFDMNIMSYPRTCMAKAEYEDGQALLYIPVHPVLMLESLAPDPALTKSQKALALWKVVEEMDGVMRLTGMNETYFVTQDDQFAERAVAAGFEEVKGHVLKRKLKVPELPESL